MMSNGTLSVLRPFWVIGLTGHRHLSHPEEVGQALVQLLGSLREEIGGDLGCVSSIAIGADTLFARAACSLSLPWRALLPAPAAEFREDFEASDWRDVEHLLTQAAGIEVRAASSSKEEDYIECGLDMVDQSDLLIAVWDGEPARGMGGTADVVAYARSLGKPLIILNPKTLQIEREGLDGQPFVDPEIDYLNNLPDRAATAPPIDSTAPENLLRFFRKVDQMAARTAPNVRRWVASSVVMNAGATILVACIIAFTLHLPLLDATAFALTAGAMGVGFYLRYRKVHEQWVHCRVAAEMCRAAIATWDLPWLVLPEIPAQSAAFGRLATSLRMMHLNSRPAEEPDFDRLRDRYLNGRIADQLSYQRARAARLSAQRRRLVLAFWVCSALAVSRGLFVNLFGMEGLDAETSRFMSQFLPLALPCLAGSALALVSVFDLNGQLARAREAVAFLTAARDRAADCRNVYALQRAIVWTEGYLTREIADWFTLSRQPRYG